MHSLLRHALAHLPPTILPKRSSVNRVMHSETEIQKIAEDTLLASVDVCFAEDCLTALALLPEPDLRLEVVGLIRPNAVLDVPE